MTTKYWIETDYRTHSNGLSWPKLTSENLPAPDVWCCFKEGSFHPDPNGQFLARVVGQKYILSVFVGTGSVDFRVFDSEASASEFSQAQRRRMRNQVNDVGPFGLYGL